MKIWMLIATTLLVNSCGTRECWKLNQDKYNEYFTFCMRTYPAGVEDPVGYCSDRARYSAYEDTCEIK